MAHRYLLVLRFAVLNIVAAGLVVAAWMQGWLSGLFEPSTLVPTTVISAVFAYGLWLAGRRVWQTSRAINNLKEGGLAAQEEAKRYLAAPHARGDNRAIQLSMMRLDLSHRIQVVRNIANLLVFLGLIGTVVGFIIALSGVDPEAASQAESVASMVATLIQGMSIALYTTLLGAVLNVWLSLNHRLLSTGTVNLMSEIVRFGVGR